MHANQAAFLAELDAVALDLLRHPRRHLGALHDDENVVERDGALELERREARQALVEPLPVGLERREHLVRSREHVRDLPQLVAEVPEEHGHGFPLLRDRDHERVGLLGHTLCRAVPRPRLGGGDRRVGHELDVRVDELRDVGVDDDGAVHLGQLVEELGREGKVEPHPAREEEGDVVGLVDDDERAVLAT